MKNLMLILIVSIMIAAILLPVGTEGKFTVAEKRIEGFHFVYYEFVGPYQKAFEQFGDFTAYLKSNHIETGPYSVGIYLDNPQVTPVEKLRSEIGFMVKKEIKTTGIYKYKKIDGFAAISTWYHSMDEIAGAWNTLGMYMMKNQLIPAGPGYEFYKSGKNPTDFSAECLFPVQEFKEMK